MDKSIQVKVLQDWARIRLWVDMQDCLNNGSLWRALGVIIKQDWALWVRACAESEPKGIKGIMNSRAAVTRYLFLIATEKPGDLPLLIGIWSKLDELVGELLEAI